MNLNQRWGSNANFDTPGSTRGYATAHRYSQFDPAFAGRQALWGHKLMPLIVKKTFASMSVPLTAFALVS